MNKVFEMRSNHVKNWGGECRGALRSMLRSRECVKYPKRSEIVGVTASAVKCREVTRRARDRRKVT